MRDRDVSVCGLRALIACVSRSRVEDAQSAGRTLPISILVRQQVGKFTHRPETSGVPTLRLPTKSKVEAFDISFLHGPLIPQGELPFHRREDVFSLRSIMGILLCPGIGGWMYHTSLG